MPKVNCPGCKSLVTFDPKEETEFPCPACGKQLRVKVPVKAAPAFVPKPKPIVVATVREPVDVAAQVEEDDDEPRPVRKKKKKRSRGPSGRVSGFLMPLGALAALLLLGLCFAYMHMIAADAKVPVNGLGYVIVTVALAISLGLGALIMQYSVNTLSKRNRVPEIEFAEAASLCPLITIVGFLGAMVMLFPLILVMSRDSGPGPDAHFGSKFVLFFFCFISGGFGAMVATIKVLLGTPWKDAASISLRFIVVSFLSNIVLSMLMGAIAAFLGTNFR